MTRASEVVDAYLELGLRLGRHIPGLVDSYYGPPSIAERVESEPPQASGKLAGDAAETLEALGALPASQIEEQRRSWLHAQLTGLEAAARRLDGEEMAYSEEVERYYGVRPYRVEEEVFARAHDELDRVLPGTGTLEERYQRWLAGQVVPTEKLGSALEALASELRGRTADRFGLPDGEAIDLELVTNEPWAAYNYYLGGLRSRVAVNTDVPVHASFLPELVAHECYPGHHTEHVWKEDVLVRGDGALEETLVVILSPQSLVSEGIASVALEAAYPEGSDVEAERLLRPLGIPYVADVVSAVRNAREALGGIGLTAACMLHEDGVPDDEARAFIRRWSLRSEESVEKTLEFIRDPLWRSYGICYVAGRALCSRYVAAEPDAFRALLSAQVTTADLTAAAG